MTIGIDSDVLVHWAMEGADHHRAVRRFLEHQVRRQGKRLGLTPQVLFEVLHVATDARRFQQPLSMEQGIELVRTLWDGDEVVRVVPRPTLIHTTIELLHRFRLGRKRILDTSLAVTLYEAGIETLVTLNLRDFEILHFLNVLSPL